MNKSEAGKLGYLNSKEILNQKNPPDYRALIKGHQNLTGNNLPKVV
jgi:hypothetical protein